MGSCVCFFFYSERRRLQPGSAVHEYIVGGHVGEIVKVRPERADEVGDRIFIVGKEGHFLVDEIAEIDGGRRGDRVYRIERKKKGKIHHPSSTTMPTKSLSSSTSSSFQPAQSPHRPNLTRLPRSQTPATANPPKNKKRKSRNGPSSSETNQAPICHLSFP